MGHTPGPWSFWDTLVDGAGGAPVCAVHGKDRTANARLITAAPDLLEACELLLIYLGDWNDMEDETCVTARRAIAKARGQEVPNG